MFWLFIQHLVTHNWFACLHLFLRCQILAFLVDWAFVSVFIRVHSPTIYFSGFCFCNSLSSKRLLTLSLNKYSSLPLCKTLRPVLNYFIIPHPQSFWSFWIIWLCSLEVILPLLVYLSVVILHRWKHSECWEITVTCLIVFFDLEFLCFFRLDVIWFFAQYVQNFSLFFCQRLPRCKWSILRILLQS